MNGTINISKEGTDISPERRNLQVPEQVVRQRKVLFVIDTLQLGGAEQSLLDNTSRFKNIHSVVCHVYKGDILKQRFVDNDIVVHSLNVQKKYGFLEAYSKLKKVVEAEKPDLIVAYLTRSEIVSRLVGKFNNIPVLGTFVNDLYCKSYNQHLSWKAKRMVSVFKLINKATAGICAGFVSNSQSIKDANAKHLSIDPEKIKVINRGRDSYKFKKREFIQDAQKNPLKFLNVSRLFTVKGHKYMILGFKSFLQKHPSATLTIVGDGPLNKDLTQLISENGLEEKVFLLGARKDVPTLLADYDCFVFPTLVEGFSGALVEAMFAGLPVLASDIAQNQEAVRHLDTGYLFKTESPAEVENAMLWFKNNREDANKLAIRAFDYAKGHFELNDIVESFETYLHTIISKKH